MQALQLRFAHRAEVDARRLEGGLRALQPTQEDLSCARVTNRPLAQPTLDFCVAGPLAVTTCGAALAAQSYGLARFRLRPPVLSNVDIVFMFVSLSASSCAGRIASDLHTRHQEAGERALEETKRPPGFAGATIPPTRGRPRTPT
jgi:hypothetical protein